MKKDLSIMVDDVKLNIRVGIIFKYQDKVLIELSNTSNSVIPGGRIKINEKSSDAIKREIKEEMDFDLDSKKLPELLNSVAKSKIKPRIDIEFTICPSERFSATQRIFNQLLIDS